MKREGLDIENPEKKLVYYLVKHEVGHSRICPISIDYAYKIFEAIDSEIKKKFEGKIFGGLNAYFTSREFQNMFEDIVDDAVIALTTNDEDFLDGVEIDFLRAAYLNGKEFSDVGAIFVDIETKMYMPKERVRARRLGERFARDYEKIREDSKSIIKLLTNDEVGEKLFEGVADEEDKKIALKALEDTNSWPMKAKKFAEIMAKYI